MTMFSKFLGKHANELRLLGSVIGVLSSVGALPRSDRQKIQNAVSAINDTANSIEKSIRKVKEATEIKIDKDAIEETVKAMLPAIVAEVVREVVKDMLPATIEEQKNGIQNNA